MRLAVSLFGNEEIGRFPLAGESDYLGAANLAPADNIPTSSGNQFRAKFMTRCYRDRERLARNERVARARFLRGCS
jgi:hypothetical protein